MTLKLFLAFAMLVIAPLTEARAQQISSSDPNSIATFLKVKKAAVELRKDSDGDPAIFAKADDQVFVVLFFGCNANKACRAVQFKTSGKVDGKTMTPEKINVWNAAKKFNKAYLNDKGEAFLVMDVVLGEKGLEIADFDSIYSVWQASIKDFNKFIAG